MPMYDREFVRTLLTRVNESAVHVWESEFAPNAGKKSDATSENDENANTEASGEGYAFDDEFEAADLVDV